MCYAQEFGLIASVMSFVFVSKLQVGFAGVFFRPQILFIHGSWFAKEAHITILMFLYLFTCTTPLGVEPKQGQILGVRRHWGREKKGAFKNIKGGPLVLSNESPPSFLVFLFLSLSTSPSLCVPLVAVVQVITTTLAHYDFAIAYINSNHREEKGE